MSLRVGRWWVMRWNESYYFAKEGLLNHIEGILNLVSIFQPVDTFFTYTTTFSTFGNKFYFTLFFSDQSNRTYTHSLMLVVAVVWSMKEKNSQTFHPLNLWLNFNSIFVTSIDRSLFTFLLLRYSMKSCCKYYKKKNYSSFLYFKTPLSRLITLASITSTEAGAAVMRWCFDEGIVKT